MGSVRTALNIMLKRPFIVFYTGLITLIYCIIDYFNPVTYLLLGFNRIGKGDFLESIVYAIQLLYNSMVSTKNVFKDASLLLIFLVVTSIFFGFLLSGYFNVINNAVNGIPKLKGELIWGIKKYTLRMAWLLLRVIFFGLLIFIIMLIAAVPAVIITKAWISGRVELIAMMVFLDVLTVGVLLLGIVFFGVYVLFWIPASLNTAKKTFLKGKRTVDSGFWRVTVQCLVFGIVFLVSHFIMIYLNINLSHLKTGTYFYSYIIFAVNWVFKTFFFSLFITFIFLAFRLEQKMRFN